VTWSSKYNRSTFEMLTLVQSSSGVEAADVQQDTYVDPDCYVANVRASGLGLTRSTRHTRVGAFIFWLKFVDIPCGVLLSTGIE
jgi:hypothetical protein